MTGLFCRETMWHQSTVGSFRMPHMEATAVAISLGQRAAHRCYGWACMQQQQLWCLGQQDTHRQAVGCMSYSRGGTATGQLEAGRWWPTGSAAQYGVCDAGTPA